MSVMYESQVYAYCDMCGENEASSFYRLAEYKSILRNKGWMVGKKTLCPACNAERRARREMRLIGVGDDENA